MCWHWDQCGSRLGSNVFHLGLATGFIATFRAGLPNSSTPWALFWHITFPLRNIWWLETLAVIRRFGVLTSASGQSLDYSGQLGERLLDVIQFTTVSVDFGNHIQGSGYFPWNSCLFFFSKQLFEVTCVLEHFIQLKLVRARGHSCSDVW